MECIKLFIHIAQTHGNNLKNGWLFLLQCLSKLDYIHSIASSFKYDIHSFINYRKTPAIQQKYTLEEIEIVNTIVEEINQAVIDSIYTMSVNLDAEAIIDFIRSICQVSKDELVDQVNPRIFSLQKLVEVADMNMSRITYVW